MQLLPVLLKSSVVLSIFLLVYYALLQKASHFNINRAFLLIGLLATVIIGFVDITYPVYVEMHKPAYIEVTEETNNHVAENLSAETVEIKKAVNWSKILLWMYVIIASVLLLRLFMSIMHGVRLIITAQKIKWEQSYLYIHPKVKNPMVFGNRIFVHDQSYLHPSKIQVLIHEQVHQHQNHWVDILASELLLAFIWFNPLVFIYRKVVLNNLEYIADRGVLNTGLQLNTYIQSILCETMGTETTVLANHFRTSQNKQRLKMMKNAKQSKWGKLKLLLALPIVGTLLWAFSEPEYIVKEQPQATTSQVERNKLVKGGVAITDTMTILKQDGTYVTQIVEGGIPDVNVVIKGTTQGTFTDEGGRFKLKVAEGDILVFSHVKYKTQEVKYVGQEEIYIYPEQVNFRKLSTEMYRAKYKGKKFGPSVLSKQNGRAVSATKTEDKKQTYFAVEELASYNGGMDSYFAQLYSGIVYAKESNNLKGTVDVGFTIDVDGKLKYVEAN